LSLPKSEFEELVNVLEHQPGTAAKPFEVRGVEIRGLEKSSSEPILNAVISLYRAWASAGDITLEEFANKIWESVATFDRSAESSDAKDRLHRILDIEPLARSAKALAVLIDNQHEYHDAKILTDIRYAFRPDPEAEPYGAVIVHTLKLTYHEESEHKSFFVALDSVDLKQLRAAIGRAEKKEKQLKTQLETAQIHYFDRGDE